MSVHRVAAGAGAARARKRFGQHFLHDPAVIDRIVGAVAPRAGDALLEIGPGRGALTERLLAAPGCSLDAIEIDRDLCADLRQRFSAVQRFTLHEADALRCDIAGIAARRGRLRVLGNLPYNISTPLLFRLLETIEAIVDLHVMLQREVIERMSAAPGEAAYGRLTLMLYPWVRVEHLFDVGPGAFQPPPRVWSALARLTVRTEPAFAVGPHYASVVATAFAHRRKTLRNALRGLLEADQIERCGIDPGARPETLSPHAYHALATALDAAGSAGLR